MFGISGGSFGGSGVRKYAVVADLPLTGVKPGTLAHVEENLQGDSALYLWSGTQNSGGWYRVATVNLAPALTQGPDAAYTIPNDGSPLVLTLIAEDPEGLPISWSFQVSEGDPTGVASVSQDGGTFTLIADPAAVTNQTAGTFSITFVASDGVSLSAATSAFTLAFSVGPADPANLTLESTFDPVAVLGVELQYLVPGEDGVLFGINCADANLCGVYALDISDPENVSLISHLKPLLSTSTRRVTACYGFGKLAFKTTDTSGFVIDVSDPANMSVLSSLSSIVNDVVSFANRGEHLVGVSTNSGIRSLSVPSSPGNLSIVSTLNVSGSNVASFVHPPNYDGDVFAWWTYSTSPGRRPLLAEIDAAGSLSLLSDAFPYVSTNFPSTLREHRGYFDGTLLSYAEENDAAYVFDVTDPQTPVQHVLPVITGDVSPNPVSGKTSESYTRSTTFEGHAYLSLLNAGEQFRIFDIADLVSPVDLGVVSSALVPGAIRGEVPVFSGGRAFVLAALDKTLRVLK